MYARLRKPAVTLRPTQAPVPPQKFTFCAEFSRFWWRSANRQSGSTRVETDPVRTKLPRGNNSGACDPIEPDDRQCSDWDDGVRLSA